MTQDIILYIHIIAASVWVGGSIFLFMLGIFLRDKRAQEQVYYHIGPLYGYTESVWLSILVVSGLWMFYDLGLDGIMGGDLIPGLSYAMGIKLILVGLVIFFTAIHMYIALKTHAKERTRLQMFLSRASSLAIFLLNFLIVWFAIQARNYL
jgi:putative copper export protein